MVKHALVVLALFTLTVNSGGCGHGSKSVATTAQTATEQATTVQGIAAAGNPISGTVYLSDLTSANTISAKTTAAGEFFFETTGLKAPFILKSVDTLNNEMFSYIDTPGTVNINPLTTLALAVASAPTVSSLTDLYN